MSERGPDPTPADEPDERSAVERWVLPYFEDSSLWPVLLVLLAAVASFIAPMLVSAVRDLRFLSIVVMGVVVVGSVRLVRWEWKLRGRPGVIGASVLVVWGLACAAAWYGARGGLL